MSTHISSKSRKPEALPTSSLPRKPSCDAQDGFLLATPDDPFAYHCPLRHKQEHLLLALFVAGKNASVQARKLEQFLRSVAAQPPDDWFALLGQMSAPDIRRLLEMAKVGQYTRLTAALSALRQLPPFDQITRDQLCETPGVSMKSASFTLMYTRPDYRAACWDTHLLKWAKALPEVFPGKIPAATPAPSRYLEMEERYLQYCDRRALNPTQLDFEVWSAYRKKPTSVLRDEIV